MEGPKVNRRSITCPNLSYNFYFIFHNLITSRNSCCIFTKLASSSFSTSQRLPQSPSLPNNSWRHDFYESRQLYCVTTSRHSDRKAQAEDS